MQLIRSEDDVLDRRSGHLGIRYLAQRHLGSAPGPSPAATSSRSSFFLVNNWHSNRAQAPANLTAAPVFTSQSSVCKDAIYYKTYSFHIKRWEVSLRLFFSSPRFLQNHSFSLCPLIRASQQHVARQCHQESTGNRS